MEKNILAGKTALPPSMLPGALSMLRPTTLWTLQWSGPNQSLQNLMHFRYYASSMGRFMKPDNIITNIANPQSWNLYTYVNGNPVNFNDRTGHLGNYPHSTSQVLFNQFGPMGLSPAYGGMWENPQGKGTMSGVGGGYEGGAAASGTETIWKAIYGQTGSTASCDATWNATLGAWVGPEWKIIRTIIGWELVSGQGGGGGNTEYSGVRESLWERWKYNFIRTNKAVPGLLAPPGFGLLTGKTLAQGLETPTLWQWVKAGLRGVPAAGVELTSMETLILGSGTLIVNTMAVGVAFEVGIAIGSLIQVGIIEPLQPD